MATQQQLLALAKQGDSQAIALLFTKSLRTRGITAKATLKGDCLRIILEAAQVPDRSVMVSFIRRGLMKLGVPSIKTVKVYGKQFDTNAPAWSQDIDLGGAIAPTPQQPDPISQSASSAQISMRSHQSTYAFKYSFIALYLIFLGTIPLIAITWLFVLAVWQGMKAYSLIAIALINVLFTIAMALYYSVFVSPTGIKAGDFWGKRHFVEWSSITAIKPYSILFLKYLLLSSTQSSKTLWLPLFLANMLRFSQRVSEYAGAEHLLTQRLQQQGYGSPLSYVNGQIKAGWLAACVVGGVTAYAVLFSLVIYNPYNLFNSGYLIDVIFIFSLAFGIYKKSRVAAVIMLIYYVLDRIFILLQLKQVSLFAILISIFFIGCFIEGIQGTFTYHKLIKSQKSSPSQESA